MQVITGYLINGANPVTVGGTGTAIKYFPSTPGPSIGVNRTTPSANSSLGQLKVPGQNRLNGQKFVVDVSGYITADPAIACPNVTVGLYAQTNQQTDGHNPVYTLVAQTTAVAAGSLTTEPFNIEWDAEGDTISGMVQGVQTVLYAGTLRNSSPKASENLLNGINFANNVPFGLVVGVTFSVSGANNSASLTQFTISA